MDLPSVGETQLLLLLLVVGFSAAGIGYFLGYTSGWRRGMADAREIVRQRMGRDPGP